MVSPPVPSPLKRQAAWVVGCRVIGIAATLAANILVARWLGPKEFGAYLLVTTAMALGGLLAMAGLSEAGLRFISESLALGNAAVARAFLNHVLFVVAIASLVAAMITASGLAFFQAATNRFHQPLLLITVAATGVVALAWQQIAAELLRGYGELRRASLFSGGQTGGPISNLLFLAGLCAAAVLASGIDAALVALLTVASICLTLPFALRSLWWTSRAISATHANQAAPLSVAQRRELLVVGGTLLINQLLAFGSQQLDIWLGGALLAPEALGLYGAAKRSLLLAAMPVQMAMLTVLATIPRLHAQGRVRELERVVRSAAAWAAVPSLAALAALALFPDAILRLIFTGAYVGATPTVLVLILGHLVLVLSGNPPHVLTMTGRHRTVLGVNMAAAVVLVVVGAAGARWFGAAGLAAGSAASLATQNGLLWWLARKQLGVWTHVGLPLQNPANCHDLEPVVPTAQES